MEKKVIAIEIKFTKRTLALLFGSLLLVVGLAIAGGVLAQSPEPPYDLHTLNEAIEGETVALAAADVVSSAISYQGRLTDDEGDPLEGTYDFQFRFYDAESGGALVDGPTTVENTDVDEGLFNVRLPIDPTVVNGQELWMQVRVREDGGSWDPWMTPLKEVRPVPYAMSLRPGAIISDTSSIVELNRYREGGWFDTKIGVYGEADDPGALSTGVYGKGALIGVFGQSESGTGVYAASSTGTALYAQGNARQNLSGNGMVKAAVYANCAGGSSSISRSFNNVNDTAIAISGWVGSGTCTIDFGFDLSDRYWAATVAPILQANRTATCQLSGSDSQDLICGGWDTGAASFAAAEMMIVVY